MEIVQESSDNYSVLASNHHRCSLCCCSGIGRSLSDTDSMPARLPAFIPRSMFVASGPEVEEAERPQLSESPVLHETGAEVVALPVAPAHSEQEQLGPISNTNLIGVSSAFYSRCASQRCFTCHWPLTSISKVIWCRLLADATWGRCCTFLGAFKICNMHCL